MMTLKDARASGKLAKFIAEHKGDAPGDADAFDRTLMAMTGTSSKHKPERPE